MKKLSVLLLFVVAIFNTALAQDPCDFTITDETDYDDKGRPKGNTPNLTYGITINDPKIVGAEWIHEWTFVFSGSTICSNYTIPPAATTTTAGSFVIFFPIDCHYSSLRIIHKVCNTDGDCYECEITSPVFKIMAVDNHKNPSPIFNDNLVTYTNNKDNGLTLNIIDISGRVIQRQEVAPNSTTSFELQNTNGLTLYFLQVIENGRCIATQKLLNNSHR